MFPVFFPILQGSKLPPKFPMVHSALRFHQLPLDHTPIVRLTDRSPGSILVVWELGWDGREK